MTLPRTKTSSLARPGHRNIIQGEYATSGDPDAMFTTILGSCVAVCLHDPDLRIGGMNHFLLPAREYSSGDEVVFGLHAMELLINDLLKRGALKTRLKAKLFGGARMIEGLSDVGARNADFARTIVRDEGLILTGESLGGTQARRIRFKPHTGEAQQLLLGAVSNVSVPKPAKVAPPPSQADMDVELF